MDTRGYQIKDSEGNIIANGIHQENLTEFHTAATKPGQELLTEAEVWHRRLGHFNNECLEIVSRNSTRMPHLTNINITCNACSEIKQILKSISKEPAEEPKAPLSQVYGDLLESVTVTSLRGGSHAKNFCQA